MAAPARVWGQRQKPVSVAGLVARFTVAGVVVTAVLLVVIALQARQAGTEQAVESAREVTWVTARGIVEPRLTPELLVSDPTATASFDQAMHQYVLQGSLVRVKLWNADGTIAYSDEPRLVGQTFPLGEEEQQALRDQSTDSEISDVSRPENQYERPYAQLLEVYVGVKAPDGTPVLFEAYFRYDGVVSAGQSTWRRFAPAALGALILLQLVQVPLAWSMARRLQRQQQERSRLLDHATHASEAERRRIAADLHDGVVQDITGLTYTLDAARLGPPDATRDAELVRTAAAQLRATTGDLRSLLVDIYPPSLAEEGLPASLAELASGVERGGVSVDLDVDSAVDMPAEPAALLFRSAQEVLRNVLSHSGATRVEVYAGVEDEVARLVVDDDGRGFAPDELSDRVGEGHVGLRSLGDLVAEAGGELTIRSAPGQGTRAEIVVPVR